MSDRLGGDRAESLDLAAVASWLCLCWVVVVVPGVNTTPLRLTVVLPGALVLPGYALLTSLRPDRGSSATPAGDVERAALAVSGSVAICTLVGIALLSTALPVTGTSALACLSVVIFVSVAVTAARRGQFGVPSKASVRPSVLSGLLAGYRDAGAVSATVVALVAIASVVGGAGTVALLTVHEPAGHAALAVEPVAGPNTTEGQIRVTDDTPLRVSLVHRRPAGETYTVVALLEQTDGNGAVTSVRRLETFTFSLTTDERWTTRHQPDNISSASRPRIAYVLYRGQDPDTTRSARTRVHLWVNETVQTTTPNESEQVGSPNTASTSLPLSTSGEAAIGVARP